MKLKDFFTIIIVFALLAFNFYLNGMIGVLEALLALLLYLVIFYGVYILWNKLKKREYLNLQTYARNFLYSVSWFVLIIFGLIGGFAYYFNEIAPATMPEYTLTDGERIVKFQSMIHIGQEDYYDEVKANLTAFKEDGGVYFFEGVRPGSEENLNKFNEALGVEFTPDLYENFSKLYGVTFQEVDTFLDLVNDLDFNVDISVDDIMALYGEKIGQLEVEKETKIPLDANAQVLDILARTPERELKMLVYINQAILNFLMSNEKILESMTDTFHDKEFFEVILGERNKVLAEAVQNSEYDKIFITYGLLHFKGFFELLKEADPRWEIIEIRELYPIS